MNAIGSIQYEGRRYALVDGEWVGPDDDIVSILNSLFRISTRASPSCAVLPLGYECIRSAAKWAKDDNPELPRFQEGYPGQIH